VGSLPPSRWIPNTMSTALSEALAARYTTVTGNSARATGWRHKTRAPSSRSRATAPGVVRVAPAAAAPAREVRVSARADSR
jgi:hypothetical protein